ncbi:MAG TPA: hypothetical protein VGM84_18155 [Steroidobacteraceae bacterium]|jgi:hypothetical protein
MAIRVANGQVWNISAGAAANTNWVDLIEPGSTRTTHFVLPPEAAAQMMTVATEARRSGFYVDVTYNWLPRVRIGPLVALSIAIDAALPSTKSSKRVARK